VLLSDRFMIGASVRYADDEFDFGDSGELDVDEEVWLLTPTPLARDAVTEVLGLDGLTFRPGQFRILIERPGGTP